MTPVVLDCTELFHNPVRTGIQRVVRELIRRWPSDGPDLLVARFIPNTAQGLALISKPSVDILVERDGQARALSPADMSSLVAGQEARTDPIFAPNACDILVPEVFFDRHRSEFYLWLSQTKKSRLFVICYDFLPFLRPDLFGLRSAAHLMDYVRALRAFGNTAHISCRTQTEFLEIMSRNGRVGPSVVLPLGADAIDIEKQRFSGGRRDIISVGSIDGRKRQRIIGEAFGLARAKCHDVRLTLLGRPFESEDVRWLRDATKLPGFRWIEDPSDEAIAEAYRQARATVYVSEAEGFGLPPVESLWAGVPVIVSADMPCLADIAPLGQVRLPTVTPETVAAAMLDVMAPGGGKRLWGEAARLDLPTWDRFARRTVDWIQAA